MHQKTQNKKQKTTDHSVILSCKKKRISNIHEIIAVQLSSRINDQHIACKLEFTYKFNVVLSFQNLNNI